MKNYRFIISSCFIVCFTLISTYSQKNEFEPYTPDAEIEVILTGASKGYVRLIRSYGDGNQYLDSAYANEEGKVTFKKSTRLDAGIYYAVYPDNNYVTFIMDKNQHFYLHTNTQSIVKIMTTNSAENSLYYKNALYEEEFNRRINLLNSKTNSVDKKSTEYIDLKKERNSLIEEKEKVVQSYLNDYPKSFFAAFKYMGQNPKLKEPKFSNGELDTVAQVILYRNEYWNNFDFNDGRMVNTPMYFNKMKNYFNLYPQRADSLLEGAKFLLAKADKGAKEIFQFTINYILNTYKKSTVMGGEKIMCYAIDNYYTYQKVFWADSTNVQQAQIKSNQLRNSLLGAVGQDLKCKNEKGEYVSLYDLKAKVKIVFLYNPDCDHCKKETPKLKELYNKWKSKGLEVYALNVEKENDKWINFINEYQLNWTNVIDPKNESKFYSKYYIDITPGVYVLDPNNKIICKQIMPEYLEPVIEKYLE